MPNKNMNQNVIENKYPNLKDHMEKSSVEETTKHQIQAEYPRFSWEDIRGLSWAFSDNEALIHDA